MPAPAPTYDQIMRSDDLLRWALTNHGRLTAPVRDADDALDRLARIADARRSLLGETDRQAAVATAALAERINPALLRLAARAAEPAHA